MSAQGAEKFEKPPYAVPSMAEIQARKKNGYKAISTFSGAGGGCLGLEMAGFEIVWASEFVEAAAAVYRTNHPGVYLSSEDIREVSADQILEEAGLAVGEIDLMEGSPPCAGFSTSGKRHKGWGKVSRYSDTEQITDDLFFEFVRLLEGLRPKTFVAENVSGLVKGSAKGYFKLILRAMKAAGYRVEARLLNAAYLGVPQARERLIFVGVREDLAERFDVRPAHPEPLPYLYTVADGISDLEYDEERDMCWWMPEGGKTWRLWNWCKKHRDMTLYNAHAALYGKESYFNHRRCEKRRPAPTIPQGSTSIYHYDEPRSLTIREAKRLSGFPDDFDLAGAFARQWERLGRSVPPVMMFHVAKTMRDEILERVVLERIDT